MNQMIDVLKDVPADAHRVRLDYCVLSYWKGNMSAKSSEEWTHVRITSLFPMSGAELSFTPEQHSEFASALRIIEDAYTVGQHLAKKAIREALGIKEPRL
jgi:hypothetical protein